MDEDDGRSAGARLVSVGAHRRVSQLEHAVGRLNAGGGKRFRLGGGVAIASGDSRERVAGERTSLARDGKGDDDSDDAGQDADDERMILPTRIAWMLPE